MSGKNVELGTVGFNLESNDSSLDSSLAKLRKFGEAVNKASNATDEGGRKIYNNMVRVEKSISTVFDKMASLTERMTQAGNSAEQINKLTSQYDRLASSLIKVSKALEPHEMVRATVGMQTAAQQATRAIRDQEIQTQRLTAQQQALYNAQQRVANLTTSMRTRGASESDIERLNSLLGPFQSKMQSTVLTTKELRDAQREFGTSLGAVNREVRESIAASKAAETQQARLIAATRNVAYLNARALRLNLPNDLSTGNNSALANFGSALATGKQDEIVSAQRKLNDAMMATRLAMIGAEAPISKLSLTMHDLSRATVLALGPLSGVGARISVITSLLDSNSVAVALFIGGMVGATAALYALSSATIKATMQQEQFDAVLISAAGSATLVGKEYEYILSMSNRMGVSVQGLVKPYADFAATARLSGMTLENQRKIFESIITTGTALRWNTESYGRAFLAITQMMSKGAITSEELRKQLGEIIPNIIGLSAAAEGVGTKALMNMIKSSDLLSNEHLPKLADKLLTTFSPAAGAGAESTAAQMKRLENATFETLKQFEKVSGVTEIFKAAVISTTNVVRWMGDNMQLLVTVMAALAGAGAGMAVVALMSSLPALITTVTTAVAGLTSGTIGLTAAINVLTSTTVVGWAIKIAGALLGAAAAVYAFRQSMPDAAKGVETLSSKVEEWVKIQEKVGITQKRTHSEMMVQSADHINSIDREIASLNEFIKKQEESAKASAEASKAKFPGRSLLMGQQDSLTNDPEVQKARARVLALEEERKKMADIFGRMSKLKTDSTTPEGDTPKDSEIRKWESWANKVTELIAAVKGKYAEIDAFAKGGAESRQQEEAHTKALKLFAEMPKAAQDIRAVSKELTSAGYSGKNLVEQFTALYLAEDKAKDKAKEIDDKLKSQKNSSEEIAKLWEKLGVRNLAVTGEVDGLGSDEYRNAKKLETELTVLRKAYTDLGVGQETINELVKNYSQEWQRITGLEQHEKDVDIVTKQLDKLNLKLGDTQDKLIARHEENQRVIERAVSLEVLTRQEGDALILQSADDLYRKMIEGGNEYYKALHRSMGQIEDTMVAAIEGGMIGSVDAFKAGIKLMLAEANAFIIKIGIVRPAMTALFGSLYTGTTSSGNGLLGSLISSGISALSGGFGFGASTPSFDAASGWTNPLGGRALGGAMNPFASYLVGEDGPEILRMGAQTGHITPMNQEGPQQKKADRSARPLIVNIYPPPGTRPEEFARSGRQMSADLYRGMRKVGALES